MANNNTKNKKYSYEHHFLPDNEIQPDRRTTMVQEELDRGHWAGPLDFLMSMIAYAVGLGK